MDLKVGDRVKFLNEEGGGVVSEIIDDKTVNVTIEDGFDIPTLKSNLIKTGAADGEAQGSGAAPQIPDTDPEVRQRARQQAAAKPVQPQHGMQKGVYLVFQTEAGKPALTGKLDVYILNNTDYEVFYALYPEQGGELRLLKHGLLLRNHREFLDSLQVDELNRWSSGMYQMVFTDQTKEPLAPANDKFRLHPKRFYKEDNYRSYPGWNSPVFAYNLTRPDLLPKAAEVAGDMISSAQEKQTGKVVSRTAIIDKHKTGDNEAKVDLHIEQLIDDYQRMNSMEILNTQLSYFRRVLESALINNIQKLVVIHGVGAGILKAEIRRELQEYDYIEVHDAPIAEYGVGATIARIYQQ